MSNASLSFNTTLSVRVDVESVDPTLVPLFVREMTISLYFEVATAAVVVFDALITIDKEVKYFWKFPRRPVDVVYFANRYIGIFGAISALFWNVRGVELSQYVSFILLLCKEMIVLVIGIFSQWSRDIANWATVTLIDYILTIRVLALYSLDRKLSICLYTLLGLEATFKLGLFIYVVLLENIAVGGLAQGVTICGQDNFVPLQWGLLDWTMPLVYGVILMALALYKAAEYWRMSARFKGFTLVKVLIEDQIIYFMLVISCAVFGILQFKVDPSNVVVAAILSALSSPSFLCVLGSRILFNLKEAGKRRQNEGMSYRSPSGTISGMEFAEPVNPEESQSGEAAGEERDYEHANQV